jgi:phage terminase small subunit
MSQRGRKSAAALSLVPNTAPRKTRVALRPGASDAVRAIVHELIGAVDPDWFRQSDFPLLESYGEAIALERKAYAEIATHGAVVNGRPSPWLTVAEKSTRAVVALSARLRLSPQNRTDPKTAGRAKGPGPSIYEVGP